MSSFFQPPKTKNVSLCKYVLYRKMNRDNKKKMKLAQWNMLTVMADHICYIIIHDVIFHCAAWYRVLPRVTFADDRLLSSFQFSRRGLHQANPLFKRWSTLPFKVELCRGYYSWSNQRCKGHKGHMLAIVGQLKLSLVMPEIYHEQFELKK